MLSVVGVLLTFVEAATGLLTISPHCSFTQSALCYGAVEHPLYLQLPSEYELRLKKDSGSVIFKFKNKTVIQNPSDYPRWRFITGETKILINSAKKTDSGNYYLETFSSDGILKGFYNLQLIIEDVVSSVKVNDSCLPPGNRSVYCSSDGDNLSFNWSLSLCGVTPNHQLTDGGRTLLLDEEAVGRVTCLVKNHVSREEAIFVLVTCAEFPSTSPLCRLNQNVPCYGAVGHPLYLHLPPEDELRLKKDSTVSIFKFKNKTVTQNHRDFPRWQFVTCNTTMIITSAKKTYSGNYTLDTFSSDGTNKGVYYLQLIIEGVVSSVKVRDSCFFLEKRSVSCSSDGDNLIFDWSLSGNHTQLLRDGNQALLLNKDVVGNVTCFVKNHVSSGNSTTVLQPCPDLLFVCVWVFEVIILMSILGSFHIYIRLDKKPKAAEGQEHVGSSLSRTTWINKRRRGDEP